ncbi:MAG: apolipoprotein N-acyltransferase [Paracoccaceae bacterium]
MTDRFAPARDGWRGTGIALLTGLGMGLGQVPFAQAWIALPALVLAFMLFGNTASPRAAFRRGWTIGAGYALIVMFWIVEPFLIDIARHGWMAPFALGFMAAGFGVFWGAGFWLARWLVPLQGQGGVALALTWTGAEMLRSYAFTGFPWALVSYIWSETPILQLSAYIGPHGLTLLTLGFAAALVLAAQSRHRISALAAMAGVGATVFAAAYVVQNNPVPGSDRAAPVIRLVQPNVNQSDKWDPAKMPLHFERLLTLTAAPAARQPDLVVWPEVAVAFLLDDPAAPLPQIAAAGGRAPVVLGAQRFDGTRAYNSIAVLDRAGGIAALYDKAHLVPFGEYLPLTDLMGRFGLSAFAAQYGLGYTAGDSTQILDFGPLGTALPLICYESIFPQEVRTPQRPDWLLLVTNDGWFGTFSGPYQHFAQARARSVELGLPMVRVANTGISAMIDARGRVIDSLPLGVSGSIDAALPRALPPTLYARTGDWPIFALLAAGLAIVAVRRNRLTPA